MIGKCEQYNKDIFMCIRDIKNAIEDYFYPEDDRIKYELNYYQESALASLLNFYQKIKGKIYNKGLRDIFIYDFNKFYVTIYEIAISRCMLPTRKTSYKPPLMLCMHTIYPLLVS
jgi:hypothetical protein